MRTFSFGESRLSNKQRCTSIACSEKMAKLTPSPSQVAPSGYGFPGQVLTVVIKRDVSYRLRSRDAQSAKSDSSRDLAEFVMKEDREQAKTDHARHHERSRRWF